MADITAIRAGIAANLETVFGTDGAEADLGITVTATIETPQAPALQVMKGATNLEEAMQGSLSKLAFIVRAYFPFPAGAEIQGVLDDLLSFPHARSVKAAIESVRDETSNRVTLDGACADLTVLEDTGHRLYLVAGVEYIGAEWQLEVWA